MKTIWTLLVRFTTLLLLAGIVAFHALVKASEPTSARTYYVSPAGSDRSGDGSRVRPWASLLHATEKVPDEGCEIVFLDGLFGPQDIRRIFHRRATIHAQHPYRACWASSSARHRVFSAYGAANFTVSGFEMRGAPGRRDEYLVQITLPASHDILLENGSIRVS